MGGLDDRRLMEHLSAKDAVLTLAGVSQDLEYYMKNFRWTLRKSYLTRREFVKNLGPRSCSSQAGGAKPRDIEDSPGTEGQ